MATLNNEGPLPYEQSRELILREIYADDARVSGEFFRNFEQEIQQFASYMAEAVAAWSPLDQSAGEDRAYVTALANGAITLLVDSMALFMKGHIVAAGNLMRQVVEQIALTLLCSAYDLPYLKNFIADKYRSSSAVGDLMKNIAHLHVKRDGVEALEKARKFYHLYSHPTRMTLAAQMSLAGEGAYVGANFDPGKLLQYKQEMDGRLGLARVFSSFIEAVKANVALWPA